MFRLLEYRFLNRVWLVLNYLSVYLNPAHWSLISFMHCFFFMKCVSHCSLCGRYCSTQHKQVHMPMNMVSGNNSHNNKLHQVLQFDCHTICYRQTAAWKRESFNNAQLTFVQSRITKSHHVYLPLHRDADSSCVWLAGCLPS